MSLPATPPGTSPPPRGRRRRAASGAAPAPATGAADRVTVRRATLRDLETVVELRLALLREHEGYAPHRRLRSDAREQARQLFAAQLRRPSEVTFLAERRGAVVGILRCAHARGIPLVEPAAHGYISSVYVVPEARRQRVLRTLLAAAIRWCKARGLGTIYLHSAAGNPAANAAWEALGFRIAEHLRVRRLRS